ncbi:MAG: hypothetical protein KY446_02185 [Proteobacteria bacterium]|nr:hypothetical protein [Pseudomonadota bacterium]
MQSERLMGLAALLLALAAAPAWAQGAAKGTDVCLSGGTGNPCNGNNGNSKGVGNVRTATPVEVGDRYGRGSLVVQTGTANRAIVRQSAIGDQLASVEQIGEANRAEVNQSGAGSAYAQARQDGNGNALQAGQDGPAHNTLIMSQTGDANRMAVQQYAALQSNAAQLTQDGGFNEMSLLQDGGNNDARLSQAGTGNRMGLTQLGDGNKASWVQQGSYLRDLQITQYGASMINIIQHNGR